MNIEFSIIINNMATDIPIVVKYCANVSNRELNITFKSVTALQTFLFQLQRNFQFQTYSIKKISLRSNFEQFSLVED